MHGDRRPLTTPQPYPIVDGMETGDAKDELRRAIRHQRQERSPRLREEAAAAFAEVLATLPSVTEAAVVATYASRPTEPGTAALLEQLAGRGARVLLPVLGAGLARDWAEYTGPEDLLERAPGRPPEPGGRTLGGDAIADADVVIAPALAVDTQGVRLGQGGGWYDRSLKRARPGVPVVAMVFPEEFYDATERPLPVEDHDVPVHAVATPEGWQPLPAR
ncbi:MULTISPECIES: 5-formyltetrahydrofolate cyclo-ligase [Isoptericola]|uniref:5-formyltetrahydrofolate cyclo-ligase n=1 Tax=Isoptericola sediminis TaxID=2733572 RepID=A0A849K467_9MICO|nr:MULTISPECIES: 5-formyltetrahydrofolate cyclo-ligase [Isoptericola]MDO8143995.1 5-formyltetrahydrofolate cyclo-ligase [Isoptericola sp. 178]MDO8149411.1 5-formyltetrahydrofolate cyclo-ligase [Isoptericola sp. b515]MDO8152358.1 5-formyltetrahydrofolate cyclo-ligase [Isoptericola sp. b408]NNU27611.1 5-formyltetrahydrofolate cyclo-ligase [Isoptericola sediminis]